MEMIVVILILQLISKDIQSQMQSYLGGTNKGSCYNYGYKTLSAGDNLKYITSGNNGNGYGDNERCYWQFYAPGAYGMGFRLEEIEVTYCFFYCVCYKLANYPI